MKYSHKAYLCFLVTVLSAFVSAWLIDGSFHLRNAVFCLPVIVLFCPLLALALWMMTGGYRRIALGIFNTGMLTYLAYAINTLSGELMAPLIGKVYIPVILITLIFGNFTLLSKTEK